MRSVALAAALAIFGCGGAPRYSIAGTLSGTTISGVTVSLSAPGLAPDRTTKTDSSGRYTFTAFRVSTKFPFALFRKSRHVDMNTEVIVFPAMLPHNT